MRTEKELEEKLVPYRDLSYLYTEEGYIVWREGTGNNLEVLFIEAEPGFGGVIYRRMVERLIAERREPYHSIFVFVLAGNTRARAFYKKMGWQEAELGWSVYKHDGTVVMWADWNTLLSKLGL